MPQLSTHLRQHPDMRDARCVLCGAVYAQYFVGVVLYEDSQPVGDVCPCVAMVSVRSPAAMFEGSVTFN